uniref:Uncharacterized protein n=1 Tax=Steinernema glaseri TaxID=37863 RepID=A0A1I7YJB1_9BILA
MTYKIPGHVYPITVPQFNSNVMRSPVSTAMGFFMLFVLAVLLAICGAYKNGFFDHYIARAEEIKRQKEKEQQKEKEKEDETAKTQ